MSRSEVDMLDIRASFKHLYKASLYTTIQVRLGGFHVLRFHISYLLKMSLLSCFCTKGAVQNVSS